jgi:3-oxoadipate enol-lactonase
LIVVKAEPNIIASISQMIVSTPIEGYCGCGAAISRLNITPRLGEISAPTLVIVGEDDPGTPVDMSEIMAKGIPGAKLVILPVARHLSNLEDQAGFNQALQDFLAGVDNA